MKQPKTSLSPQMPRLEALDALRGFAACMVAFLHHYHQYTIADMNWVLGPNTQFPIFGNNPVLAFFISEGALSVHFFWVLSGFVFAYVYKEAIAKQKISPLKFFVWRFSRLYPLYFLLLLLSFISISLYEHNFQLIKFLQDTTFLSSVFIPYATPLDIAAWSVSVEIVAYFVFFLVTRKGKGSPFWFLIPIGVAAFVICLPFDNIPVFYTRIGECVMTFFFGCFAFEFHNWLKKHPIARHTVAWFGLAAALASPFLFSADIANDLTYGAYKICDWLIFPLLILAVLNIPILCKLLSTKVFIWLGNISFSLYLIHIPLYQALRFIPEESRPDYESVPVFLVCVAGLLGLATLSYHFFEIPVQNRIRKAFRTWEKQQRVEQQTT